MTCSSLCLFLFSLSLSSLSLSSFSLSLSLSQLVTLEGSLLARQLLNGAIARQGNCAIKQLYAIPQRPRVDYLVTLFLHMAPLLVLVPAPLLLVSCTLASGASWCSSGIRFWRTAGILSLCLYPSLLHLACSFLMLFLLSLSLSLSLELVFSIALSLSLSLSLSRCLSLFLPLPLFRSLSFPHALFSCRVALCSVLFCSVLFCSVLFCSVLFCSILFCSVLFC